MIVVIDTNVFARELHLLRSGAGPLFLHFLKFKKGSLFVPEILRREYIEQTVATVQEMRQEIDSRFERLHALVGERDAYRIPSDRQVAAAAESRLQELTPLLREQPLTDEILLAAAKRSLEKRRPSIKSDHGLKDCVIWESILRLPTESDVHFVSHDKAFFDGEKLEASLDQDARKHSLVVTGHDKIEGVVRLLQDSEPPLDVARVLAVLNLALQRSIDKVMKQWNIGQIGPGTLIKMVPYFTEKLERTYVTFAQEYESGAAVVDSVEYVGTHVVFSGSFHWYADTGELTDLQVESERLVGSDGSVIRDNRTIYARGAIVFGRRPIPYVRKGPLLGNSGA